MTKGFNDFGFDYESEFSDLNRRQKLLDVMQGSMLQPMKAPEAGRSGNFEVAAKIHPLEAAARVLQGYMIEQQNKSLAEEKSDFRQQGQQEFKDAMTRYYDASQTDPRGALLNALTEKHPMMQAFAMEQLKNQKGDEYETFEPTKLRINKRTNEIVVPRVGPGVVPGQIPGVSEDGTAGPGWYETNDERGNRVRVTLGGTEMVDKAPKNNVRVSVSPVIQGEGAFMKGLGEAEAKEIVTVRDAKKAGQQTLATAARLEQLVSQGAFSGPLANVAVVATSLTDALNKPGVRQTLANSEEFKGIVGKEAAAALTGPGGAKMTDKDMELFLSQYPQLTNSKQGQQALIQSIKRAATRNIEYADKMEKKIRTLKPEAATLFDLSPSIDDYPTSDSQYPVDGTSGSGPVIKNW